VEDRGKMMKKTYSTLIGAGISAVALLAVSTSPALSECIQKHPVFGFDTYVDDKYCAKKPSARKTTKKKMAKASTSKTRVKTQNLMRVAAADNIIKEMQTLLAGVGYDPGPIDGHYGPKTKEAAKAFKQAVGLRTGTDAEETVEVLRRVSGK